MSTRPRRFPRLKFVRTLPPRDHKAQGVRYGFWQDVMKQLSARRGKWARVGSAADYRNIYGAFVRARGDKRARGRYRLSVRGGNLFAQRVR